MLTRVSFFSTTILSAATIFAFAASTSARTGAGFAVVQQGASAAVLGQYERSDEMLESMIEMKQWKGTGTDESLPSFYMVPMRGQMGTDIHPDIYKDVVEDIDKHKPDVIVYVLHCADVNEVFYIDDDDKTESGLIMIDEYRKLVNTLKDSPETRDIKQVMWVHDSVGISSLMALSWEKMYMTPDARLMGLQLISQIAEKFNDPDVRMKMMAAWTGIAKGFLNKGGYPLDVGEAMMRPEFTLSATFDGRDTLWSKSTRGDYIVDSSSEHTANFRAKIAEDLSLSDGAADRLEDLAFLLGYREFRVNNSGEELVSDYMQNWRRQYEESKKLLVDYQQHLGWASGEDTLKYLGRAKRDIEEIISAMERYPAVEIRFRREFGTSKFNLEILVEQLIEQIRAARESERGGRGGRRGGGGGSGGLGR